MPDDSFELNDELQHVLDHARPEERMILAMRYLHDWDYARIAGALAVSEGAARVRVHRALSSVRGRLADGNPGGGKKVMAGIAALPLFELGGGRLDATIAQVLEKATAQLGPAPAAPGSAVAGPWTRIALLGLQFGAAFTLIAAGTPHILMPSARGQFDAVEMALLDAGPEFDVAQATDERITAESTAPGLRRSPRPRNWDDGALGRVARGERELRVRQTPGRRTASTDTSGDTVQSPLNKELQPLRNSTSELSATSRPTSQGACAARCDSVSSQDERAGVSGGSIPAATRLTNEAPEGGDLRGPGLLAADAASANAAAASGGDARNRGDAARRAAGSPFLADRLSTSVRDLPPEAAQALSEAIDAVDRLVRAEFGTKASTLLELATSRSKLKRAQRSTGRAYRRMRRKLRRAAESEDAAGVQQAAAKVERLSTVNQVLALLVAASTLDADSLAEFRWPDGFDVQGTLDEVVRVLGEDADTDPPPSPEPEELDVSQEILELDRLPDALR